jgi:chaperonin GroEL (HSP60 family)
MGAAISKKAVGRPFVKGQSGNPNGRPKMPKDLKEAFKAASPKALEILKKILADPAAKDSDRLRAAEIILDRAYGKPAQAVDITTDAVMISETLDDRLEVVSRALTAPPEAITRLLAAQQCIYSADKGPDIVHDYTETAENIQNNE